MTELMSVNHVDRIFSADDLDTGCAIDLKIDQTRGNQPGAFDLGRAWRCTRADFSHTPPGRLYPADLDPPCTRNRSCDDHGWLCPSSWSVARPRTPRAKVLTPSTPPPIALTSVTSHDGQS